MAENKDIPGEGKKQWERGGRYSLSCMLSEIERDRENFGPGGGKLVDQARIQSLFEEARGNAGSKSR